MKRRRFVKNLVAAPAVPALLAQQPPVAAPPAQRPAAEAAKLEFAIADDAAETVPRFFSPPQYAALRRLSDMIMPPAGNIPGALAARAPEFLDFLVGASPPERRTLYTAGLDALNAGAVSRFGKPFADLDPAQASELLEPLRRPWTYEPPSEPLTRFLLAAKEDVRTATVNSREWTSASSAGGRRAGGIGQYWSLIE